MQTSTSAPRRRILLGAAAVGLVGIVALVWILLPRSEPPHGDGIDSADRIVLELPPGTRPGMSIPYAKVIEDLTSVPTSMTGRLLAAGRFEPSGARFPEGIRVTWPLADKCNPGTALAIVALDEDARKWHTTGETAIVADTGRRATGKVYHFSIIGVEQQHVSSPSGKPLVALQKDKEKKDDLPHVAPQLVIFKPSVTEIHEAELKAARNVYEAWKAKAGKDAFITWDVMRDIYRAADFETVKTLIEDKAISAEHSVQMADLRVMRVLQHLQAIGQENNWVIFRSDTGNQESGMASDMDQTILVYELKDGKLVRNESLDRKVVELFTSRFESREKISLKAVDIATIPASDNFPDPRVLGVQLDQQGRRAIEEHAAESMYALRKTRGAYTFIGPVLQQMQLRVLEAVEQKLRKGGGAELPPDKVPPHPDLKKMLGKDFRRYQMNMFKLAPGEDGNEFTWQEVFQEEAMERIFDGKKPQLLDGHRYDCAVADYLFHMDHFDDPTSAVKYVLRPLDSHTFLPRAELGLPPEEYAKLGSEAEKQAYLQKILAGGEPLAGGFLERWKTAFDIAAAIRNHHKKKTLSPETEAEAYRPLAEELAGGENRNQWRDYLPEARREFARRCQEFLVRNIIQTSTKRVMEWLSTDYHDPKDRATLEKIVDETSLRKQLKLEGDEHTAEWNAVREELARNYSDLARLQLVYSFRDLHSSRPDIVQEIVKLAERRGIQGEDLAKLKGLVEESRTWVSRLFFDVKVAWRFPRTFYYFTKGGFTEYLGRVEDRLFDELGLVDVSAGRKPSTQVEKVGTRGVKQRFSEFMAKYDWSPTKFLKGSVLNIGGLQSLSSMLRAYSESGGDPDVTLQALLNELVNMLPVVGPVKALLEAEGAEQGVPGSFAAWISRKGQPLLAAVPLGGLLGVPGAGAAGIAIVIYTIGENGLVLYEHEYSRPLLNELADAVYRGYVGPSLYVFAKESTPPQFTDKDKEALEQARAEIEQLKGKTGKAEQLQLQKSLLAERLLAMKRAAWQTFQADDNRYRGGAILGTGAQLRQKPLNLPQADPQFPDAPLWMAGPLLARVKPMIFYSRSTDGDVDFMLKPLTDQQKQRKAELDKILASERDPEIWVNSKLELLELEQQEKGHDRARRYLEAAAKNRELMHQIRLDSIWPYMLGDTTNEMVNPREFVDRWLAVRREMLPGALKEVGITKSVVSKDVHEALAERLLEDTLRSRRLWEVRKETLKGQEKLRQQEAAQIKRALMVEVLSDNALNPTPQLSAQAQALFAKVGLTTAEATRLTGMAQALRDRSVPEAPAPRIKIGVRKIPDKDENGKPTFLLRTDVKIIADPTVYRAPYRAKTFQLGYEDIQKAVSARNYLGLPLSEEMVQALKDYLPQIQPPKSEDEAIRPAVLVFVFCDEVRIPDRVIKETTSHLPSPPLLPIPGEDKKAYLLGGAGLRAEGPAPPTGPLRIVCRRVEDFFPGNDIDVTSEALSKLAAGKKEAGLKFVLERSLSAGGPWLAVRDGFAFGESSRNTVRLNGVDTFSFHDSILGDYEKGVIAYKPVFYRVVQQGVIGANATDPKELPTVGDPTRSNVVGPGAPFVRLSMSRPPRSGDARDAKDSWQSSPIYHDTGVDNEMLVKEWSQWITLGAELVLPNEYYRYYGTEFTVTAGTFRGFFFDQPDPYPVDPKRTVTYEPGGGLRVPFSTQVRSMTISAGSAGAKASRTISVSFDPKILEQIRKRDEENRKWDANTAADRQKETSGRQQQIAKRTAEVADNAKSLDRDFGAVGWCDASVYLEYSRYELQRLTEVDWPRQDGNKQVQIGLNLGDYGSVLEARKRLLRVAEAARKVDRDHIGALEKINEKRSGYVAQFKLSTDVALAEKKNIAERAQQLETSNQSALATAHRDLMAAALLAGDMSAYQASPDALTAFYGNRSKASLASLYMQAAEELVILTGNRTQAAHLLTAGHQLALENLPEQEREARRRSWETAPRPAWWPPADDEAAATSRRP